MRNSAFNRDRRTVITKVFPTQFDHFLYLAPSQADKSGWPDRCTALFAELGVQRQFRPTRPTRQSCRCQRTATFVPPGVHVSIVSPRVSDVSHIAVPPQTRGS